MDDSQAIQHVLDGQVEIFRVLVVRYQHRIFRYVIGLIIDQHESEDITQDVFLAAFQHLAEFQAQRAAFATWLYTIARNRCINHSKRKIPAPIDGGMQSFAATEAYDGLAEREFFVALDAALQRLPIEQQEAFILAEIEELPYLEIAAIQQVSPGTVKSRVHRAKQALRTRLACVKESYDV